MSGSPPARAVRATVVVGCVTALLLSGCSGDADEPAPQDRRTADATVTGPAPSDPAPSDPGWPGEGGTEPSPPGAVESSAAETLPPVRHRLSLPRLMREQPDGGRPRILRTEVTTDAYTRSQVIYRSGDRRTSGVLLRPHGEGPFPAIVLNHGYIDPAVYRTGQGLAREQDALARAGFVVLHTDYGGHAASDPIGRLEQESRLAYTTDAVNAVAALRALPYVDDERLAMLGRSMGGAVTMNALVTHPGLVRAAVLYASVSSELVENIEHFTARSRPDRAQEIYVMFGSPRENPGFYADLSPRTFFDRITEPLLVHHGTADATCPPRWATETQRAMRAAGVRSRLRWYDGEDHAFYARWQDSMDHTIAFLRRQLEL